MGIDIYYVFQKKEGDRWVDIASEYNGVRDRYLYTWLQSIGADGQKNKWQQRGFPADFSIDEGSRHWVDDWKILPLSMQTPEDSYIFMGEWGFSWLLGSEILAAQPPVEAMTIWIPIDVYNEWDGISNPERWHELHSDWQKQADAEHYATPENITENTWWVIVDRIYDFTEDFEYFIGEVRRLVTSYGDVRFVFSFG